MRAWTLLLPERLRTSPRALPLNDRKRSHLRLIGRDATLRRRILIHQLRPSVVSLTPDDCVQVEPFCGNLTWRHRSDVRSSSGSGSGTGSGWR